MTLERWRQIEELYHRALELGEMRPAAFLRDACAGDRGLQEEVERLLAAGQQAGSFLKEPAFLGAARELAQERPTADTADDARPTQLGPGAQLGPYRIETRLGAGGMGEVFRAIDTRLGRKVAIKVSAQQFSERFDREARAISALNHSHICTLYDIGHNYLVMEFVEGETLAARLEKGPLPMELVLRYGAEIAGALAAAHAQGITHRDLKPANIMVTKSGVKVLDFGLAKIARPVGTPKQSASLTASQAVMGTLGYMAPEQLEGKGDARSDIFSLGLVLYEMATGRKAFTGGSQAALIADVMRCQPTPMESVPEKFTHVVERSLARDPDERWQTAKDLKAELSWAGKGEAAAHGVRAQERNGVARNQPTSISRIRKNRERVWWVAAMVVVITASIVTARFLSRIPIDGPEIRLEITTPPTTDPISLAISPDGRKIVFAGTSDGRTRLWVRPLDSTLPQPLAGTDGATFPFWSPDSRSVGFFADRQLKRIDVEGGTIQALAAVEGGRGGAWAEDGTILFQPTAGVGPLFSISAGGGKPIATEMQHGRFPQFLPNQRHFLYFRPGTPDVRGVYVGQLGGSDGTRLLEADGAAVYVGSGHVLFVRQQTLFAQAFDQAHRALTGEAFAVAEGLTVNGPLFSAPLSASASGPFAYRTGSAGGLRQFAWFDRSGKEIGKVGEAVANLLSPSVSPDSSSVAVHRLQDANMDVWLLETRRGVLSRFTSSPWAQSNALWAPDGTHIVFSSSQNGPGDLVQKAVGSEGEEFLLETPQEKWATGFSPDGRFLLYVVKNAATGRDLWVLPMEHGRTPFPVVNTEATEEDGQFSPDGKWIAYQSNESGRVEVYVQSFPDPGRKIPVSSNGGAQARWRPDGKELFYIGLDGLLMSASMKLATNQTAEVGTPFPLFATRVGGALQTNSRQAYMVSDEGQRFLMNTITEEPGAPIIVILNWKPKL
jgi:eukaryotic-like serine/threonine-protein kinase